MIMKWEDNLKDVLTLLKGYRYNELYNICLAAYTEGFQTEKQIAIEAYRLRCRKLFGNRCMTPVENNNKICDGECLYIRKFKAELFRLEN